LKGWRPSAHSVRPQRRRSAPQTAGRARAATASRARAGAAVNGTLGVLSDLNLPLVERAALSVVVASCSSRVRRRRVLRHRSRPLA